MIVHMAIGKFTDNICFGRDIILSVGRQVYKSYKRVYFWWVIMLLLKIWILVEKFSYEKLFSLKNYPFLVRYL